MNENKVTLVSTIKGNVGVNIPDLKFKRDWPQKGSKVSVDKDVLKEAMYDPGFDYMLKTGMLYIEDMEAKKELELEPADAKEPTNIIVLTDDQKKRYLTVAPLRDLKEVMGKLSREQKVELAQYAVANRITDIDRCRLLKEATEMDVLQMIILLEQAKEE